MTENVRPKEINNLDSVSDPKKLKNNSNTQEKENNNTASNLNGNSSVNINGLAHPQTNGTGSANDKSNGTISNGHMSASSNQNEREKEKEKITASGAAVSDNDKHDKDKNTLIPPRKDRSVSPTNGILTAPKSPKSRSSPLAEQNLTSNSNTNTPTSTSNSKSQMSAPKDLTPSSSHSISDRQEYRQRHGYYGMQHAAGHLYPTGSYYAHMALGGNPWPKSSIFAALQKFYKTSEINLELNALVIKYIAKTGDLPVLSSEELNLIPKLKFGQHIHKMERGSGFMRASSSGNNERERNMIGSAMFDRPILSSASPGSSASPLNSQSHSSENKENMDVSVSPPSTSSSPATIMPPNPLNLPSQNHTHGNHLHPHAGPPSSTGAASSSGRSSKLSMVSSDSEMDDSDDEMTVFAWKENYMKQYGMDINENDTNFKTATDKVFHARKIWKVVQSVIEKKILCTIDEYNRNYNYEKTEKKRCESKNCEYIKFYNFKKAIHRRFVTYFDEMPPFTLQRICELLDSPQNKLKNCGKYMRALDKNLQVTSFWQPFGYSQLLELNELDSQANNNDEMQSDAPDDEEEDRGSIFNDTASMHSISKHSWHSRSMQSPRSVGSQSPYHTPGHNMDPDSELASIIRDVGPGCPADMMNRVPSPLSMNMGSATTNGKPTFENNNKNDKSQANNNENDSPTTITANTPITPLTSSSSKRSNPEKDTSNNINSIPPMSPPKKQKTDQNDHETDLPSSSALKNKLSLNSTDSQPSDSINSPSNISLKTVDLNLEISPQKITQKYDSSEYGSSQESQNSSLNSLATTSSEDKDVRASSQGEAMSISEGSQEEKELPRSQTLKKDECMQDDESAMKNKESSLRERLESTHRDRKEISQKMSSCMRGILVTNYGNPDVLQLRKDLKYPKLGPDQIIIKVRACAITSEDVFVRSGGHKQLSANVTLNNGINNVNSCNELPYTPGTEISGFVEEVGSNVKKFNIGDRVYTFSGLISGGSAQFSLCDPKHTFKLPECLTFRQGCVLGLNYFTAYTAIIKEKYGNISPGQNVCISCPWNSPVLIPLIQVAFASGAGKIFVLRNCRKSVDDENEYGNEYSEPPYALKNPQENTIERLILSQVDETLNVLEIVNITSLNKSTKIDLLIDSQANVSLNKILRNITPKSGKIILLQSNNLSLSNSVIDNFLFEYFISNEITLKGLNINNVKFNLSEQDRIEISLQLYRWVNYGFISPCPGKEFPMDQVIDGHRYQLVESGPYNSVLII